MSATRALAEASAALRAALTEQRAQVMAGDLYAMQTMRANLRKAFDDWRSLIDTLDPDTQPAEIERIANETRDLLAYVNETLSLLANTMASRHPNRGVA